jgi:gamma-glutamyltranspeptidase/glutathione hydrolase
MAEFVGAHVADYARFPQNAELYVPGGRPVEVGALLIQPELAATLQHMADEEAASAGQGRSAGLAAARAAFYEGDIARAIAEYHREHGGWLTRDDLAGYQVSFEAPVRSTYRGAEVFTAGRGARVRCSGRSSPSWAIPICASWAITARHISTFSRRR